MILLPDVPDQPGVEAHGREHGQDHDPGEKDGPRGGLDGGQVAQAHQGHHDGDHVDIDHGPAAHRLGDAIEPGAVARAPP